MISDRVSVVIPVFNAETFLGEAIESVLAQTHPAHEIIVVDDGSTDGSGEVAARYPVTLLRQQNRGVSDARNLGVCHTTGDYLAFLDADDVWLPSKTEDQLKALDANPEAGFVLGYIRHFFEADTPPHWFKRSVEIPEEPGFGPPVWLIRRAVWEEVGPLESGTRGGEDLDWLTRANDLGVKYFMLPKLVMLRRVHEGNQTGQPELIRDWLRVLRASAARKRALGQG
jgi:glycosyltransferase involved in cell wall biosynthesis